MLEARRESWVGREGLSFSLALPVGEEFWGLGSFEAWEVVEAIRDASFQALPKDRQTHQADPGMVLDLDWETEGRLTYDASSTTERC